jgi:hypothetical protein
MKDLVWDIITDKNAKLVDEVESKGGLRYFKLDIDGEIVIRLEGDFACLHDGVKFANDCPLSYENREEWLAAQ